LNTTNWKDIGELIGIAAIVASLIFVGLQMRQSQRIAIGEGYLTLLSSHVEIRSDITDHVSVWTRGAAGDELSEEDAAVFKILVGQINDARVMTYLQVSELRGSDNAKFVVDGFAAFLYHNPGARRVWVAREESFIRNRELLVPDGQYSDGVSPSFWMDLVTTEIAVLEQANLPIDKDYAGF